MGNTTNVDIKKAPHTAQVHLGVEYLESKSQLVLSLGYRDDEPGYPAKITSKTLGTLNVENPAEIEAAMEAAAVDVQNVICHEFYVTDKGEFVMVLLSHG